MARVHEIAKAVEKIAPSALAEDWDNPGLQVGDPDGEVDGALVALTPLREVFEEDPIEDETYPLRHDEIDLEQPIRDLVVPELPPAPLCDENCLGLCPTCGANRNPVSPGDTPEPPAPCECGSEARDPRWDALRALVITDDPEHRSGSN